jgi:hypothetical protein
MEPAKSKNSTQRTRRKAAESTEGLLEIKRNSRLNLAG